MSGRSRDPDLLLGLLDHAPALVMLIDDELTIRWVNQTAGDLFGYTTDEAIGRSVLEFLDPDWDPAAFDSIGTALRSEGMRLPMTFRVIAADGTRSILEVTANSQFHNPDVSGFVVYARPWNERWLLDRMLEAMASGEPMETSLELLVEVAGAETIGAPASLMFDRHVTRVRGAVAAPELGTDLVGPVEGCAPDVAAAWMKLLDRPNGEMYDVDDLPEPLAAAARSAGYRTLYLWPADDPHDRDVRAWAAAWRTEQQLDADETRREMMARLATLAAMVVDRSRAADDLSWAATHDELTGLRNRSSVYDELETMLDGSAPTPVGVVYVDLDGFKPVNDRLGHSAGDRVLQEVAQRMLEVTPDDAVLARLGGDEFVIVAERDVDQLTAIAARIIAAVAQPIVLRADDPPVTIGASAGVAVSRHRTHSADHLIDAADRGLYESKGTSRRVVVHEMPDPV